MRNLGQFPTIIRAQPPIGSAVQEAIHAEASQPIKQALIPPIQPPTIADTEEDHTHEQNS